MTGDGDFRPCPTCRGVGDVWVREVEPLNVGRAIGKVVDITPRVGVLRVPREERRRCPDCGGDGEVRGGTP